MYGDGDTTFQAAGGEAGVRRLVESFYTLMETRPNYQPIWQMHADAELDDAAAVERAGVVRRDKLARFLCAWMGGPKLFSEKYGPISIPNAHGHLHVSAAERDLWLSCMAEALASHDYPADFVRYLLGALWVPAERIRELSSARHDL